MNCLLCLSTKTRGFHVAQKPVGNYFICLSCDFIFMDPKERLPPEQEKARYFLHENKDTAGYRNFFEPLVITIVDHFRLDQWSLDTPKILDFGCGPTNFLSEILLERGLTSVSYDPIFAPNETLLEQKYDAVICTEVWEHFYRPAHEISRLRDLLKPNGMLLVMTSSHKHLDHFQTWHYRRDPTHVGFFSEKTMIWIANHFKMTLIKGLTPYWFFQENSPC